MHPTKAAVSSNTLWGILKLRAVILATIRSTYYALASYLPDAWLRRNRFTIEEDVAGERRERVANKLCVFASFDGQGVVDPYVFRYLECLQAAGFDIVFVTTSREIADGDLARLRRVCRRIVRRANAGYDFYSWRTGLLTTSDLTAYGKVLLANDSVFGPFGDLGPLFARMDADPGYLWGLCDSLDTGRHHLQSWFLYMDRAFIMSQFFRDYWESVRIWRRKWDIIEHCEIGFSVSANRAGFPINACFPYAELKRRAEGLGAAYRYRDELAKRELNPTLKMWDILLQDMGFPFLKAELLKSSYYDARGIEGWRTLLPESERDGVPVVDAYLKRIGRQVG